MAIDGRAPLKLFCDDGEVYFFLNFYLHLWYLKRITIIFLLGIFTLSNTELIELTKLPLLLTHFAEHQSDNEYLSLYEFMVLHYSSDSHHHDNHDEKLPFKSHDHIVHSNVAYVLTKIFIEIELKPEFESIRKFTIPKSASLTSTNPSSIWQPPKIG